MRRGAGGRGSTGTAAPPGGGVSGQFDKSSLMLGCVSDSGTSAMLAKVSESLSTVWGSSHGSALPHV